MKNHVLRPLMVAIAAVALLLTARHFYVPDDFGVNGRNFTFGFYRAGNLDDQKALPVKYKGKQICAECHEEQYESNMASKHHIIPCENCHGPAGNHPENPEKLTIDKSRALCIRCHAKLPYPNSARGKLPGIDPVEHNPESECSECHNPHKPSLEDM
jgi:predicted CXXCH cytochrome family protein